MFNRDFDIGAIWWFLHRYHAFASGPRRVPYDAPSIQRIDFTNAMKGRVAPEPQPLRRARKVR